LFPRFSPRLLSAMFSATICIALAALIFSPPAAFASPGLSVHISGPQTVQGIENLILVTTMTNTGDETLKLLNDPRSLLSNMSTDTFIVRDAAGRRPSFHGIRVKYIPSVTAVIGNEDAFTILAPGESVDVGHDLSKAYNFTFSGSGSYIFGARSRFYYVEPSTSAAIPVYAHVVTHEASISGRLVVHQNSTTELEKRAYFSCSGTERDVLQAAAADAQAYVANALAYFGNYVPPATRYTTWFGRYDEINWIVVRLKFDSMNGNRFGSYLFDCSCTEPNVYASSVPNKYGIVRICPLFWTLPLTGSDSMAGTLVHESSHFLRNGETEDWADGIEECLQLALDDPDQAIDNGDSFQYFAENTPPLP